MTRESLVKYDRFFQELQSLIPKKYLRQSYLASQNKYQKNKHVGEDAKVEKTGKKPFDVEEISEEKMTVDKIDEIDVSLPDTSIQQLREKIQLRLKKGQDRNDKIEQRRNELLEKKKKEKEAGKIDKKLVKKKMGKVSDTKKKETKIKEVLEIVMEEAKPIKEKKIKVQKPSIEENMSLPNLITESTETIRHTLPKKEKLKLDLAKAKRADYQKEQIKYKIRTSTDHAEKEQLSEQLQDKEWKKAMKRASGEKVRDDVKKIKKSMDKIDKKKDKSRKDWKKRSNPDSSHSHSKSKK